MMKPTRTALLSFLWFAIVLPIQVFAQSNISVFPGPDSRNGNSLKYVEAGISSSTASLTRLGFKVPQVSVFLSDDPRWLTENYLKVNKLGAGFRAGKMQSFSTCNPQAEAGLGVVFLCEGDRLYRNKGRVTHIVAHELWHTVVQYGRAKRRCCTDRDFVSGRAPGGTTFYGPQWLLEGSAEMFAEYVAANGNTRRFRNAMKKYVSRTSSRTEILNLTSRQGFNANDGWTVGPAAAFVLTDGQFAPFAKYFSLIGAGSSYRKAFERAFGMTQKDFSTSFLRAVQ
ncbi:MAG: hypothetical protein AAGA08_01775 [Pseudomonadota bacterium]